ncbi:protein LSM12 homolog B [Drosophila serrata]|uniref:protein LSM12 homolog B n=1 Tax=Drosophila serrata TaxID=7274 RepID=UPI000A1D14E6|nr:protein LSM12 homolog B [Drosophila serrata]
MSMIPCFTLGSIVRCKTCFNEIFSGEVLAFDLGVKMLMMRCPASKGGGDEQTRSKLIIVNLSMCRDIEIVKEVLLPLNDVPATPERLDLQMLQERLRHATDQRSAYCRSYHLNVSPFGQALYRMLVKQFGNNLVMWQEQGDKVAIRVIHDVIIKPPYAVEDVEGTTKKSLMYVRSVVESFHNKQE